MAKWSESFFDGIDTFFAWLSTSLKQTTASYCELETADSPTVMVNYDGTLVSILKIEGITSLAGVDEFERSVEGLSNAFHGPMKRPGHALQVHFSYDKQNIKRLIRDIYDPAEATERRLELNLEDLFNERVNHLADNCAEEHVYFVLMTRPITLINDPPKTSGKSKFKGRKEEKPSLPKNSRTEYAEIPELRDKHHAYVHSILNQLNVLNVISKLLGAHEAVRAIRMTADPDVTPADWRASLPGDKVPASKVSGSDVDAADLACPSMAQQIIPRDVELIDRRTVLMGNKIYSSSFIETFPKNIKPFVALLSRTLPSHFPWRISFLLESEDASTARLKRLLESTLSFSFEQNILISDPDNLLNYLQLNPDTAITRVRIVATTWAAEGQIPMLRRRSSELAKAIEAWGSSDVSEVCGEPFAGVTATMLATSMSSPATAFVVPIQSIVSMLPISRPASPWKKGAQIFRSPDGKPWPFQPGSELQNSWIDLVYGRSGSGKSILSNALNLALCLSGGLSQLPRIAIIDVGPSSNGLISLLKEALPAPKRDLVVHYRLRMTPEYTINPFDTQLGSRYPTVLERSFLVNFLSLLASPLGAENPYDGMADLIGTVIDELYKNFSDEFNPKPYSAGVDEFIDSILEEIGFVADPKSTWWGVTDSLYSSGFAHEAMLAQRQAMPVLADVASVCRIASVVDMFEKLTTPTGETLIDSFARMVLDAVGEYIIFSGATVFDIGDARVVALDLEDVVKSGGDEADRQTSVMYMLGRYVLARHYYLTEESMSNTPLQYQESHKLRIREMVADPKRIVYDEFHRTFKSSAIRAQVILDMREAQKHNVQISLLSQLVDDFDSIMIDLATSIYIMDAGPSLAVETATKTFRLSESARIALRSHVHGPIEGSTTFLAKFSTKTGMSTQVLTLTLGPIELWALGTIAEDVMLRNQLYHHLGPVEARRFLASLFNQGSAIKEITARLSFMREEGRVIDEESHMAVLEQLVSDILETYTHNSNSKMLTSSTR
jgi:intracellular multiplication protein IcmB